MKQDLTLSLFLYYRVVLLVDYDVVVVGAGPAGISAGRRLASSGARVAILDQESDNPKSICDE